MTSMFALWAGTLLAIGGSVTEVTITPMASQTSILVATDELVEYRSFAMEGPHRLVIDLMGATHALPQENFAALNRGGIVSMRTSQYAEDVVRLVFVLEQPLGFEVIEDPRGLRIQLDNPVGDFEPWSSGARTAPEAPAASAAEPVAEAPQEARRISVTWTEAPINDVLLAFAAFSGKSIVPGANVEGFVTADINDQPWDVALSTILAGQGLVGEEDTNGIIRVDNISDINEREQIEPILTRAYRISYGTVAEIQTLVTPLLTERGNASSSTGANTLVVSDIQRVQNAVSDMLQQLDVETPQVSIQAKIIFVNRTELDELGVTYELKDSRGNQLNRLSSGFVDPDGDGPLPATEVQQGTQTVLLGGNSIAALGNATNRVTAPSLQLLTSMVIGRHTLVSFIDALESVQLSDIEATPQLTVLDNQPADLLVGELTPIRVVDAGAAGAGGGGGGGGGGQFPTAQVEQQETGIKLQATPHVTGDKILLEVLAERSAAELADSDAGFIFRTQRAQTRVLVGDGETVVIGGLTQSERIEAVAGIPLLMDLPLIGGLFRIRRDQEIQRDLIILVTPTLVRSSLR